MSAQPRARSRLGQAARSQAALPDFETLLASKGSTIRVRASEDRQPDSSDGELEEGESESLSSAAPTPPRKRTPQASRAGTSSAPLALDANGPVRGRQAALRDIARELALDEGDEEGRSANDAETGAGETMNNRQLDPPAAGGATDPSHGIDAVGRSSQLAGTAPLPPAMPGGGTIDKALPMSPPDLMEADLRRRSQYRSPGLAASDDPVTLVKSTSASNGQVHAQAPRPVDDLASGSTSSRVQYTTLHAPAGSPMLTVRGHGSPRSRVSSDSGSRRPTPGLTTVSSLQAAMDLPRARAPSNRSDSATSFVHINDNQGGIPRRDSSLSNGNSSAGPPSALSVPTDTDLGTVTSISSSGSTTKRSRKLTKGGGEDNSISSAMRKTSGFFRKTFGSKDSALTASGTRRPSTMSVPNTPTSTRFSTYDLPDQPSVPSIPPAYAHMTPTRRTSLDTTPSSSGLPQLERQPSRTSSQATSSKVSPAKSLGRFSSFAASFRSSDNRSTTDIHGASPSTSTHTSPQRTAASGMKTSTSTVSTEQERLARELHQWQGYEQSLEMLAPQESGGQEDTSMNTIKARTSIGSTAARRPSIPSTPPQANRNRSRSNSAAGSSSIFMSGSIPSPQISNRSPRPSNPDAFFMSGSVPSPQQAQKKFQNANGTSTTQDSSPSYHPAAMFATGSRTPSDASYRPSGSGVSHSGNALSPAGGKQIRKRSTSTSGSLANTSRANEGGSPRTPTVRLVATPSSGSQSPPGISKESAAAPASKASIGLGLAMAGEQEAPTDDYMHRITSRDLSPARSHDIPRLSTQSPSPATAKVFGIASSHTSPTPAQASSTSAAVVTSETALDTSIGSLQPDSDTAKSFADKCWNEDESFLKKEKIAEWLGGHRGVNQASLSHYMQNFEFKGLSLEMAFRGLCDKLYLRAETQQVDRILAAFSSRYIEENPDSIFQTKDIVHAVTYAMLLLNTDLHVADVANRMSRSDFIFNTMSAIHAQNSATPSIGTRTPASSASPAIQGTNGFPQADRGRASSSEQWREEVGPTRFRLRRSASANANGVRTGLNDLGSLNASNSDVAIQSPVEKSANTTEGSHLTGRSDAQATGRLCEADVESALKDIYNAVRSKAIMQPFAYSQLAPPSNNGSLYGSWNGSVNRTPSRRSQGSIAGNERSVASKRNSIRGFLGASHESLRATSPTPSFVTSMSGGYSGSTFGSAMSNATSYYPATMGFASNLSHSIIKEQQEDDAQSEVSDRSTSDEELALLGAPWAKEGILQRKHYWDAPNKRSKDKHWLRVFAVISKGEMKMFQFGGSSASNAFGGGIGGGNWLTNAQVVGEVPLAHSLSSAMPPPGYNRSRPHVLVLTLSSGGSYFFQAGTEDLVNEWVLTCNYWAGRTSREPLLGGVSNMDYGWNRVLGSTDSQDDTEDLASVRSGRSGHSRVSKMSYTATLGRQHGQETGADRAHIFDWKAPQPPSGFSTLSEDAQFDSLRKHTLALETELERHNDLRLPMLKMYSPRSANGGKAAANWEKKSKYLLAELVKYQTYVEALKVARKERQKRRDEKQVNRLLEEADDNAALGDPNYVPELDKSVDSTTSGNTFRNIVEADISGREEMHVAADSRNQEDLMDEAELDGRCIRSSATSTSTAAEFYEARDGRASTDT